jgi:hypothetical protein
VKDHTGESIEDQERERPRDYPPGD